MDKKQEYHAHARAAIESMKHTSNRDHQERLLRIAIAWTKLAQGEAAAFDPDFPPLLPEPRERPELH